MSFKSLKEEIKKKTGLTDKTITYIILALTAVLLLLIINGYESSKNKEGEKQAVSPASDNEDYCQELTKQLESIVSEIEGAGRVRIMLTVSGTSSNEYQTDIEKSSDQERIKTVIIGNKEVLVKSVLNPQIEGVLVVCDGGGSVTVREKIINAVSTVLNISSNRVYVTNRIKER